MSTMALPEGKEGDGRSAASATGEGILPARAARLDVVLCGSYRRDPTSLRRDYQELLALGCAVLSPRSVDFVGDRDGFVLSAGQENLTPLTVELEHLSAIQRADFVWLHAPEAYVGASGSMELGFAHAVGVPVYARVAPADITLREFVTVVASPEEACRHAAATAKRTPSRSLSALQTYYEKIAAERGYEKESARDCLLLLTEEIGELARAVRKTSGLVRHGGYAGVNVAAELADVQLYLVHLANILGVDLGRAVVEKEAENDARFRARGNRSS